jgi:hypothetical protein
VPEAPGFHFTEEQARDLVEMLQRAAMLLNDSAGYARDHCDGKVAEPFLRHIAQILADLGWDVLEQGFYKEHPSLRPPSSSLRE